MKAEVIVYGPSSAAGHLSVLNGVTIGGWAAGGWQPADIAMYTGVMELRGAGYMGEVAVCRGSQRATVPAEVIGDYIPMFYDLIWEGESK